ncbi:MAG: hypothetical protein ACI3YB_02210 [Prevotella sp.]
MDATEKTIALFTTRVRQMILQYEELKEDNANLLTLVEERDSTIKSLEKQLAQAKKDYDSLKMARMIEVTNGDLESAQKRLSKLIRDVNKCITLISEK